MSRYHDYLEDTEHSTSTKFTEIDQLLDSDDSWITEEHDLTVQHLEEIIDEKTRVIQKKQRRIEVEKNQLKTKTREDEERIKELKESNRQLKKEGYQPPFQFQ